MGWIAAFRPRAPRDARPAIEGVRVAALASLPGVVIGWAALEAGGAELAARLPLISRSDLAVSGTTAFASLLVAIWIRAAASVAPQPGPESPEQAVTAPDPSGTGP